MKGLVIYYSRTGWTKKVAKTISDKLNYDQEEIIDSINRSGLLGFLRSGYHAATKKLTKIKEVKTSVDNYDLTIIGTPIWAGNIPPAVRTFLKDNSEKISETAFFSTSSTGNPQNAFEEMKNLIGKNPVATLSLKTKEIKKDKPLEEIDDFIDKIRGARPVKKNMK